MHNTSISHFRPGRNFFFAAMLLALVGLCVGLTACGPPQENVVEDPNRKPPATALVKPYSVIGIVCGEMEARFTFGKGEDEHLIANATVTGGPGLNLDWVITATDASPEWFGNYTGASDVTVIEPPPPTFKIRAVGFGEAEASMIWVDGDLTVTPSCEIGEGGGWKAFRQTETGFGQVGAGAMTLRESE
jgi:hypothetical protein